MDWWIIVTVALAVAGIVSTVILTLKLHKTKKPSWAHKTTRIIGLGTDAPPELELSFGDKPVSDVFRTTLIMFNRGRETIRREDVTENVTIRFQGAEILREPKIKARSKEHNEFRPRQVNRQVRDSVQLEFRYLDHEDGAVIEVLHTESQQISCTGNIIGAKALTSMGEFEPACSRLLRAEAVIGALAMIIGIPGATCLAVLPEPHQVTFWLPVAVGAVLGLGSSILAWTMPRYLTCRRFPGWTRGVLTDEASNLAEKGFPTEAYCFECRAKKVMKNPKVVTLKNGHHAARGVCPDCGTKIRIGPAEEL